MASARPEDPLWELVLEIADRLWVYGEYAVVMERVPTQPLVDVQWAGLQAGRLIGTQTDVQVIPCGGLNVTVRVTFVDPDGRGLVRAQQRLDALRRSVRSHQEGRRDTPAGRPPPTGG